MFSKRKDFNQNLHKFDKAFLVSFVDNLKESWFWDITVKLPHNLVETWKDEINIQDFVDRWRNYPSIILIAKNNNREIIKILFVNISKKAFFKDDTFPSWHSEPSELYVQSPDPARVYSLFGYFYDYLRHTKKIGALNIVLYLISIFGLAIEMFAWILRKHPLFDKWWIDVLFIAFCIVFIGRFFYQDTWLYVKEKEHKNIAYIKRALKWDFRDNPIINIIISLACSIVAGLILEFIL